MYKFCDVALYCLMSHVLLCYNTTQFISLDCGCVFWFGGLIFGVSLTEAAVFAQWQQMWMTEMLITTIKKCQNQTQSNTSDWDQDSPKPYIKFHSQNLMWKTKFHRCKCKNEIGRHSKVLLVKKKKNGRIRSCSWWAVRTCPTWAKMELCIASTCPRSSVISLCWLRKSISNSSCTSAFIYEEAEKQWRRFNKVMLRKLS